MNFLISVISVIAGILLMAFVGIKGLVALFSSMPLARRKKTECPDFDLKHAYRRIIHTTILVVILITLVTILVISFAPSPFPAGYLIGMILALIRNFGRMSPTNEKNRREFDAAFSDCYLVSEPTTDCSDLNQF